MHPRWSAWSFLVYAGGLTVLGATGSWFVYLGATSGDAGYAGWTLLVFAILGVVATGFRGTAHPVTAGVFAFVAVIAYVAFLSALWTWFGWDSPSGSSSFSGFHFAQLLLELLWLVAALVALRRFHFPLLAAQAVLAGWIIVTDVISNGGWWSAVVTLFVGLFYLVVALALHRPVQHFAFARSEAAGSQRERARRTLLFREPQQHAAALIGKQPSQQPAARRFRPKAGQRMRQRLSRESAQRTLDPIVKLARQRIRGRACAPIGKIMSQQTAEGHWHIRRLETCREQERRWPASKRVRRAHLPQAPHHGRAMEAHLFKQEALVARVGTIGVDGEDEDGVCRKLGRGEQLILASNLSQQEVVEVGAGDGRS